MANLLSRRDASWRGEMLPRRRDVFSQLQEMFDRMFGQWAGPFHPDFEPMRLWELDVRDDEHEVRVRVELPGFEPDEIDVRMDGNTLTIQAEKKQEGEEQQSYRSFFRSVTLPAGVDVDKVKADYRNGILELHMPRSEAARPKRIQVQAQQEPNGAGAAQEAKPQEAPHNAVGTPMQTPTKQ
jgi:HSP20 family protein